MTGRPSQLTREHYSTADQAEFRLVLDTAARLLTGILAVCAPNGTWQPEADDFLGQLTEADELLDRISQQISAARRTVRTIDTRAREAYLDQAVRH